MKLSKTTAESHTIRSNSRPKRILFVHSSDELYGSDIVLLQLVSGLHRQQFEPTVVLPSDVQYEGRLGSALDQIGVAHYSIKMGVLRRRYFRPLGVLQYLLYLANGVRQICQIIRRHQIDLIHSNTSAVLGGAIAARICHLPHVWHIHEILTKPVWLSRVMRWCVLANSDCIVCISEAVANYIDPNRETASRHMPPICVIRDAVDCAKFSPQVNGDSVRNSWGVDKGQVIVGVVGRISHWKGQDIFIEAAAQAAKEMPELFFMVIGSPVPGDESRFEALRGRAQQLGLASRISFVPYATDMPSVMRALDILALPSTLPEPLGLVVLEAMACARPVAAAAHGGPLEIIKHGETSLLFAPRDADALAQAIVTLACDSKRRDEMGRKARQHVLDNFSLETFNGQFHQLYMHLLAEPEPLGEPVYSGRNA